MQVIGMGSMIRLLLVKHAGLLSVGVVTSFPLIHFFSPFFRDFNELSSLAKSKVYQFERAFRRCEALHACVISVIPLFLPIFGRRFGALMLYEGRDGNKAGNCSWLRFKMVSL